VSPAKVLRGGRELARLLQENNRDLRGLDLAGFRRWLNHHLARWQNDPVFARRWRIRDLRRAHPRLHLLEQEQRRAAVADAAAPGFPRLDRLCRELNDADRAVSGLAAALEQAEPPRRPALHEKLDAFRHRRQALQEEQDRLTRSSPPRQALLRAEGELREFRSSIGLDREEADLDQLLRRQGVRSGRAGESFEELALTLTRGEIVPDLVRGGAAAARLCVLRGVTLGAARTELDQVVVRPGRPGRAVEVLAVVEAKRNLNDLAHGFRQRQENLAWLTGAAGGYDPAAYRTRQFPAGHFDREAVHEEDRESFLFAPASFRRFRRESAAGPFLARLYFITRPGPLRGVSTAALSRIQFRVATDERWDPGEDAYLGRLLDWCRSLAERLETPDVLRLYAEARGRGRQVLLILPRPAGGA
jgi:hypothetical protein